MIELTQKIYSSREQILFGNPLQNLETMTYNVSERKRGNKKKIMLYKYMKSTLNFRNQTFQLKKK